MVNAACGKNKSQCLVNTSEGFYKQSGIRFLGIEAFDMSNFLILPYFESAANFIDEAIKYQGNF